MLTTYQVLVGNYPTSGSHMPMSIDGDAFRWRNPISLVGIGLVAFFAIAFAMMVL